MCNGDIWVCKLIFFLLLFRRMSHRTSKPKPKVFHNSETMWRCVMRMNAHESDIILITTSDWCHLYIKLLFIRTSIYLKKQERLHYLCDVLNDHPPTRRRRQMVRSQFLIFKYFVYTFPFSFVFYCCLWTRLSNFQNNLHIAYTSTEYTWFAATHASARPLASIRSICLFAFFIHLIRARNASILFRAVTPSRYL